MVLFSIIIPTFNRGDQLQKLLDRLYLQIFQNFEIIVVDDGSTDQTYLICREYRKEGLFYLYQSNQGVSSARNRGALAAKGMFLIFLDTDDSVTNQWLEDFHIALMRKPKCDLIICETSIASTNSKSIIKVPAAEVREADDLDLRLFKAGAYAVSKSLFVKTGMFDRQIRFGENTELAIRILQDKPSVALIACPNFIYTPSLSGGSKNLENKIQGNLQVLEKHPAYFAKHTKMWKSYLQVTAVSLMKLQRYSDAQQLFRKSLKLFPYDLKIAARYFRCWFYRVQSNRAK